MERLRAAWASARNDIEHAGVRLLIGRVARRGLSPVCTWRTLRFFERDLSGPVPDFRARMSVQTRLATAEDLTRFQEAFARAGTRREELEARRQRGDLCFLGIAETRLVHFMWLCRVPSELSAIGAIVELGPDEGLVYSSFTDPAARGQAVQPAVANFMIRHEQALGLRRHFYYVLRDNYAGEKIVAGKHAGTAAIPTRTVRCVGLAGLPGTLLIGFRSAGRPRLTLGPGVLSRRLGPWVDWLPRQPFDAARL